MSKGPRPCAQRAGAAKTGTDAIFTRTRALHCCLAFAASLQGKVAPPRGRRCPPHFPHDVDVAGDGKSSGKHRDGAPGRGCWPPGSGRRYGEHGAAQLQAAPCRERAAGRLQRPATAREGRADRPGQAREAEWGICAPLAVHWVVPSTTLQQLVRS